MVDADLVSVLRDRGIAPNLRKSSSRSSCAGCAHFGFLASRAWAGDGMCYLYDVPTHGSFICDSFLGEDELPDGNGERASLPAKRNLGVRKVAAYNPFHKVSAHRVQSTGSGPSTADLLAGLEAE